MEDISLYIFWETNSAWKNDRLVKDVKTMPELNNKTLNNSHRPTEYLIVFLFDRSERSFFRLHT